MTNNLQQLDKKRKYFQESFGAVGRIPLVGYMPGCTLLLRRNAYTHASAGYLLPSGSL